MAAVCRAHDIAHGVSRPSYSALPTMAGYSSLRAASPRRRASCAARSMILGLSLQQSCGISNLQGGRKQRLSVIAMAADGAQGGPGSPASFLSLEEAGLVEMAGLDMHERFLARLTVSSLNLLRVISEQEQVPIEELNAGRICDWFLKDKAKREDDVNSAVLKWEHGPGAEGA